MAVLIAIASRLETVRPSSSVTYSVLSISSMYVFRDCFGAPLRLRLGSSPLAYGLPLILVLLHSYPAVLHFQFRPFFAVFFSRFGRFWYSAPPPPNFFSPEDIHIQDGQASPWVLILKSLFSAMLLPLLVEGVFEICNCPVKAPVYRRRQGL